MPGGAGAHRDGGGALGGPRDGGSSPPGEGQVPAGERRKKKKNRMKRGQQPVPQTACFLPKPHHHDSTDCPGSARRLTAPRPRRARVRRSTSTFRPPSRRCLSPCAPPSRSDTTQGMKGRGWGKGRGSTTGGSGAAGLSRRGGRRRRRRRRRGGRFPRRWRKGSK